MTLTSLMLKFPAKILAVLLIARIMVPELFSWALSDISSIKLYKFLSKK